MKELILDTVVKIGTPTKVQRRKLQAIREKAAFSILLNVPRKKKVDVLDSNSNEGPSHSEYQNVGDVTKEESET